MKYVLFTTEWGLMGLLGHDETLSRLILPMNGPSSLPPVKELLFCGLTELPQEDPRLLLGLQEQLKSYFIGHKIDRWECNIDYSWYPAFTAHMLREASKIPYSTVITYGELARSAGSPRAARAVGQAMGRNNTPLVIPCHRVIGGKGRLTGFGAPGGLATKKALLQLEGLDIKDHTYI